MLNTFALTMLVLIAVGFSAAIILLSIFIGRHKVTEEGKLPYECGLDPAGDNRSRISIKFFMTAILFIVFDIEIVFLYPWAVVYRNAIKDKAGTLLFSEMAIFLGILIIGFVYIWRSGALNWED